MKRTLIVTDERCEQHAGFENYSNIPKRVRHKDEQPENAERLMVLIDKDRGVLTAMDEFKNNNEVFVKEVVQEAAHADVFRVHDYNYLMKVIDLCENKLKNSNNEFRLRYGKCT